MDTVYVNKLDNGVELSLHSEGLPYGFYRVLLTNENATNFCLSLEVSEELRIGRSFDLGRGVEAEVLGRSVIFQVCNGREYRVPAEELLRQLLEATESLGV